MARQRRRTAHGPLTSPKTLSKRTQHREQTVESFPHPDEPTLRGGDWLAQRWETARLEAADAGADGAVLVLDEMQEISGGIESVAEQAAVEISPALRLNIGIADLQLASD